VIFRFDRRALAAAALVCWVAGMAMLARRRHNVSDVDLLARGALRLEPSTYFYVVYQDGQQIGSGMSSIDSSASGFTSRATVRVRALIAGDSQSVVATSAAYLSRGFALDSFALSISGDQHPLRLRGTPEPHSGVLLPTLAPVALMLTREPRIGASSERWVYNPVARRVERVTLTIAAESLFNVVDSATFDSTARAWIPAHQDTVRSWKIVTPADGISAWVDSQGRIVAAHEAGGASLMRSTYEIATLNPGLRNH
jgi:hypothetical protein